MVSISVFGSLNYDFVTTTDRVPEGGETVLARSFETHHGGKGANQARAARRLIPKHMDIKVQMIGKIGDDAFGREILEHLHRDEICVACVETSSTYSTGTAIIIVENSNGQNRILVSKGANDDWSVQTVPHAILKASNMVILQNEIPLHVVYQTLRDLEKQKSGPITIYNPSPSSSSIPDGVLTCVDYLVVNEEEARDILHATGLQGSVRESSAPHNLLSYAGEAASVLLHGTGVKAAIVITLGSQGCHYCTRDGQSCFVPSKKVEKIVDTTGAGDTFLGGLAAYLAMGKTLDEATKFATEAAAISITRKGAGESIPWADEVLRN